MNVQIARVFALYIMLVSSLAVAMYFSQDIGVAIIAALIGLLTAWQLV